MSVKFVIALIFSVYCVTSVTCLSYKEAIDQTKVEYKINDEPLDYFKEHGQFPAGSENLKCFFESLSVKLKIFEDNKYDHAKIVTLREENKSEKDLELFSDPVLQACSNKFVPSESRCTNTYEFIKCGVELGKQQRDSQ